MREGTGKEKKKRRALRKEEDWAGSKYQGNRK